MIRVCVREVGSEKGNSVSSGQNLWKWYLLSVPVCLLQGERGYRPAQPGIIKMRRLREEEQIFTVTHNEERANAGSSTLTGEGGGVFIFVTTNSDLSNSLLYSGWYPFYCFFFFFLAAVTKNCIWSFCCWPHRSTEELMGLTLCTAAKLRSAVANRQLINRRKLYQDVRAGKRQESRKKGSRGEAAGSGS